MPSKLQLANEIVGNIASKTDAAILFCSLGKDSLVVLDLIYHKFRRVVCVFMYFVPGLEHIRRWQQWLVTRYPNVEFVEIPHWCLSYILKGGLYCVPNPQVKLMSLRDTVKSIRLSTGLYYVFLGMKKADGMNRRLMLLGYADNLYENLGMVYPLAEWTQKDVLAYMRQQRMPTPVRYGMAASSGIGFNLDCFLWMREHYPEDLQKVFQTFPLAEREMWKLEQQQAQLNNPE